MKNRLWYLILLVCGACATRPDHGQDTSELIRLNQVGFYPNGPKVAVVVDAADVPFYVLDESGKTVFEGQLDPPQTWSWSEEEVRLADFSRFSQQGTFRLSVPEVGISYPFEVKQNVFQEVAVTSLKALYYQRNSAALPEAFAGPWHRTAGHPDMEVIVHPSAASVTRPAGFTFASPQGWYDAGDYNKYIVPAAFTSYYLLAAYELNPVYFADLEINIPESGNALPDVLDEALWNLRWMMTMQDPADGGLYHKLTHAGFSGMVMPEEATAPRYVVMKTTPATLDFAAAMAQASRIYTPFEQVIPGFADSCIASAVKAWEWARANPEVAYDQRGINEDSDPDVGTGAYGDRSFSDEFAWAAIELYLATGQDDYYQSVEVLPTASTPYYMTVGLMGSLSLVQAEAPTAVADIERAREAVLEAADAEMALYASSAYAVPMDKARDFIWGGNGIAATKAVVLLEAYRITNDRGYLDAAISMVDYLLGRNATGYSFLTGVGDKTPMYPHHRQSEADEVEEPVPGMLVGGPANVRVQDCEAYPSDLPAKRFLDDVCSYSTNEITTYWNVPLTFAAATIDAILNTENR